MDKGNIVGLLKEVFNGKGRGIEKLEIGRFGSSRMESRGSEIVELKG